jgi:LysM repeat protein
MTSITHQAAHKLLQRAVDEILTFQEQAELDEHLKGCSACQDYAKNLNRLQQDLRYMAQRYLNEYKVNLSIPTIVARAHKAIRQRKAMGMLAKITAVPLLVFAFLLMSNFLKPSQTKPDNGSSAAVPMAAPIPTPTVTAATIVSTASCCTEAIYVVQENDTLDAIATKFSVSSKEIRTYNHLTIDSITPNMRLVIPLCRSTPKYKTITPTFITTLTPPL